MLYMINVDNELSITKTRLFKYTENFTPQKTKVFR